MSRLGLGRTGQRRLARLGLVLAEADTLADLVRILVTRPADRILVLAPLA
jgi:hypothetical protein